ncbi:Synaptic vesicle glycoprotein 2A [Goodea atripinnis]|uniref:Synaptic vesicle glycoprotein 2A n=1 Tax=Goodea atripinnis TaxID=208336 RepID=A0ABV0PSJ0_9TELE
MMVGAFLWGGLADKTGRRRCLILALAINCIFAFLSSFAQGYGFFLFFRLLSGIGIGGTVPIVYSYFSEFLQMDKRGEHLSWLCMFWMIGGIYASFTAWGIIPRYGMISMLFDKQHCGPWSRGLLHHVLSTCLGRGIAAKSITQCNQLGFLGNGYITFCQLALCDQMTVAVLYYSHYETVLYAH